MDSKKFFYDFGRAIYHIDAVYDDFAKQSGVAPTLLWILYALNDAHTKGDMRRLGIAEKHSQYSDDGIEAQRLCDAGAYQRQTARDDGRAYRKRKKVCR